MTACWSAVRTVVSMRIAAAAAVVVVVVAGPATAVDGGP